MRRLSILLFFTCFVVYSQNYKSAYITASPVVTNYSLVTYLPHDSDIKSTAKEIAQFRAKEFIINNIIGDTNQKEIKFETESLASDNSGGLISVAFNCNEVINLVCC